MVATLVELAARWLVCAKVRPRSVLPGRQRWDVPVIRGRPRVAELLETRLKEIPGITTVQASVVSGRVLILHAAFLTADDVGRSIRRTVSTTVRQAHARARGTGV